jgi:hypothetical protein
MAAIVTKSAGVAERFPADLADFLLQDPDNPAELAERVISYWNNRSRYSAPLTAFSTALRSRSWDDMSAEIVQAAESIA